MLNNILWRGKKYFFGGERTKNKNENPNSIVVGKKKQIEFLPNHEIGEWDSQDRFLILDILLMFELLSRSPKFRPNKLIKKTYVNLTSYHLAQ